MQTPTRWPESWDQKGKFPQALKPMLSQLAILAIQLDEYDEHFFNLMPTLFPYNKFTMSVCVLLFSLPQMMRKADSSRNRNSSNVPSSTTTSSCSWHGKMRCLQSWRCRQRRALQRQRRSGSGVSLPGVSLFFFFFFFFGLCLRPFFHLQRSPLSQTSSFSYTMVDSLSSPLCFLLRSLPPSSPNINQITPKTTYSRSPPHNRQTPRKTPSRSRRRSWSRSGWRWRWRGGNRLGRAHTTSYGRNGR